MNRVADDEVLPSAASVAIDGSKFKAVNTRDKNFTRAKVERRHAPCAANGEGSGVRSTALPWAVGFYRTRRPRLCPLADAG